MAFIHETANVSFKYGSKAICNYLPNQPLGYWINAHDFNSHRLRTYRESRIVGKVIASERCAVESMPLCYVWQLGFDWTKHILHDCYRRLMIAIADLVLTINDWMTWIHPCSAVGDCQIFEGARKYAMKYHTFQTRHVQVTYALVGCITMREVWASRNLSSFEVKSTQAKRP